MTETQNPANVQPAPTPTLFGIPTNLTPTQWSKVRQVATFLAGMSASLGLVSATKATALVDALLQAGTTLAVIATGIASLVGIASAAISSFKASDASQIARVAAIPNTMVVQTTAASSDISNATKIAAMPEVVTVLTSPAVADATVSHKVVPPTAAQ